MSYSIYFIAKIGTIELESGKIILRIIIRLDIIWSPSPWHPKPSIPTQLPHLINPTNILPTLIPIITQDNPFPDWPFNQLI